MSASKTWSVRSSSFGADYEIRGETLASALRDGLARIVRDVFRGSPKGHLIVSLKAEWEADIFDGDGGVEVILETRGPTLPKDYVSESHVSWIRAERADMPKPVMFSIRD